MKITMWIMLLVGIIEVGANVFFLINRARGNGFTAAKKFHGDLPSFASDKAWMNKVVASLAFGFLAFSSAFLIYINNNARVITASIFSGGMLLMCIIEAVLYGKKHLPAKLSVVLGIALVALVFFRI